MSNQFKIGEIAIYIDFDDPKDILPLGAASVEMFASNHNQECEVMSDLFFDESVNEMVYDISFRCGGKAYVSPDHLRKRPQQDDNLFTKWFESHIITDIRPTETQVRQGLKGILQPSGESHGS